jgi:hypothetical protein
MARQQRFVTPSLEHDVNTAIVQNLALNNSGA